LASAIISFVQKRKEKTVAVCGAARVALAASALATTADLGHAQTPTRNGFKLGIDEQGGKSL
jgi:hypothetical protein